MIPKIKHSRSKLQCHLNEYEDGSHSLFVSADTYPELFTLSCRAIVDKSPTGWKSSANGNMRYLWFPALSLNEADISNIHSWKGRFEQYVLIGPNRTIQGYFTDELDFCMALDYNYDPSRERRTFYGEAEFELKYGHSSQHLNALHNALTVAFGDFEVTPVFWTGS